MTDKKIIILSAVLTVTQVILIIYLIVGTVNDRARKNEISRTYNYYGEYINYIRDDMNEMQAEAADFVLSHKDDILGFSRELLEFCDGDPLKMTVYIASQSKVVEAQTVTDLRKKYGLENIGGISIGSDADCVYFEFEKRYFGFEDHKRDVYCITEFCVKDGEIVMEPFFKGYTEENFDFLDYYKD